MCSNSSVMKAVVEASKAWVSKKSVSPNCTAAESELLPLTDRLELSAQPPVPEDE